MQAVSLEQLTNQIKKFEAMLVMWNEKLAAHLQYARAERDLVCNLCQWQGHDTPRLFIDAHKRKSNSEEQLIRLEIAQHQSSLAVARAMLEEAKNPTKVIQPGLN